MSLPCVTCQSHKAPLTCCLCQVAVCKSCVELSDEEAIEFLDPKPSFFSAGVFCQTCFAESVAPILAEYESVLERAKGIHIFYKTQSKESRFVRRHEKPIRVQDCDDHDHTIMKLAFSAAQAGFNMLVDVETQSEKIRNGGWQTSNWSGHGTPTQVDEAQLERRFVGTPN